MVDGRQWAFPSCTFRVSFLTSRRYHLSQLLWMFVLTNYILSSSSVVQGIDLPFGDINIFVLTDLHSWIGGHPHEYTAKSADLGDVLSFYERVQAICNATGRDLWLVLNGDWVYGTGLAMAGNATHLLPLLTNMPWDVVTMGNQETKEDSIVRSLSSSGPGGGDGGGGGGFLEHTGTGFVTSNILLSPEGDDNNNNQTFFGSNYHLLKGKHSTVLVFGFLNPVEPPYSTLLNIETIQTTIKRPWFGQVLQTEQYDAILILAHMDASDPAVKEILDEIRNLVGGGNKNNNNNNNGGGGGGETGLPIQFLTGHTHKRAESRLDAWSHSFQAGAYMTTLGFVSFPNRKGSNNGIQQKNVNGLFRHEFLTPTVWNFKTVLGTAYQNGNKVFSTSSGRELSLQIHETQSRLGLQQVIGCPPQEYFRNKSLEESNSLWRLYQDQVVPKQLFDKDPNRIMYVSKQSWQYDLRCEMAEREYNQITVEDVIAVAPYNRRIVYIGKVPAWILVRIQSSLNIHSSQFHELLPDYIMVGEIDSLGTNKEKLYKLYTHDDTVPEIVAELERLQVTDFVMNPTKYTDTLLWLDYIQQYWQCPHHEDREKIVPWWIAAADESKSSSGSSPIHNPNNHMNNNNNHNNNNNNMNNNNNNNNNHHNNNNNNNAIPNYNDPTRDSLDGSIREKDDDENDKLLLSDEELYYQGRKKLRRRIKTIIYISIGTMILVLPIIGFVMLLMGKNLLDDDFEDTDGGFYDPSELVSHTESIR